MPATLSVRPFERHGGTPTLVGRADRPLEGFGCETSITFGERSVDSVMRLLDACTEASRDESIDPVSPEGYQIAEAFLRALSPRIPLPDVLVHPDGEIAFEWHRGKRHVLTVSVASDGSLAFAGLFGE